MTSNQTDGATLLGREVYDRDGDKIGSVGQVYADDAGRPTWASVSTGLLGLHQSLVPLAGATSLEDGVQVPFDKATVKDAPRVDHEADQPLTSEQVQELYRHYQLQMDPASTMRYERGRDVSADTEPSRYDRDRNLYTDTEPMDVIAVEDDLPGDEGRRRLA
ncbi:PRC-barrel domain-containing protein [Dactylosporangium sp. CA-139114]|uniref:PRC-barrel domain-containing protein n=1 Tax=Dactylosporangium sp. CA-139114 TaxID=3239931 RepID=UPI003D99D03E